MLIKEQIAFKIDLKPDKNSLMLVNFDRLIFEESKVFETLSKRNFAFASPQLQTTVINKAFKTR